MIRRQVVVKELVSCLEMLVSDDLGLVLCRFLSDVNVESP